MTIKTKEKKKIERINIMSVFLIFALIFYNNETFPSIYFKGPIKTTILLTAVIAVVFFFNVYIRKIKIDIKTTGIVLCLIYSIFITMFLNADATGGYFKMILCLLIGYMLLHFISFEDFINLYINTIILLAAYSLVLIYLIRPITFNMPIIIFPKFSNAVGLPLIDARLCFVPDIAYQYRNFGIFREPGVYQIFLNLALMFELFFKKIKPNTIKIIIFYIAIVSTFSSPGYIAGAILIMTYIFLEKKRPEFGGVLKNKKQLLLFLVIILAGTGIFYSTNNIFRYIITGSVNKLVQKESSYQGRIVAVLANLSIWSERPIFGYGIITGSDKTLKKMQESYYFAAEATEHNTSTVGLLLSTFGLVFTSIYIYLFCKLLNNSNQSILVKIFMFLAIMITINTQLLLYNELLYTIIIYGLYRKRVENNKRPGILT